MLFPELKNLYSSLINLDHEARKWLVEHPSNGTNPLLEPTICQAFIDACHRNLGVDFSYGGYLENRSTLWRGSYLDQDQRYIHLGVDFNVPAGTSVAINQPATIIRIDNDYPEEHGWGTRVVIQEPGTNVVMLYAHLDQQLNVAVGDKLETGSIIGRVGLPPYNGDWFPHLHVQVIDLNHYHALLENSLQDLDGYGRPEELDSLKKLFPDPMKFVSI